MILGRPGRPLVGIDIGASAMRFAVFSGSAGDRTIVRPTPAVPRREDIAGAFAQLAAMGKSGCRAGLSRAPGLDARGRIADWPSRPRWRGFDLAAAIRSAGIAATIADVDDAVATVAGEYLLGGFAPDRRIAAISLGTGLAIGLIIDGIVQATGDGAEGLAHRALGLGDRRCRCGRIGCVQAAFADPRLDDDGFAAIVALLRDRLRDAYGVTAFVFAGGRAQRWRGTIARIDGCTLSPAPFWSATLGAAALACAGRDLRSVALDEALRDRLRRRRAAT
ncbi:MAG: ROK family protein [Sphingomonadales bacterium]|nr:ROK family protein [Sphingomonadales bacterium]